MRSLSTKYVCALMPHFSLLTVSSTSLLHIPMNTLLPLDLEAVVKNGYNPEWNELFELKVYMSS